MTACPNCWTIPALDGSCCCEDPVPPPLTAEQRKLRRILLDVYGETEPTTKPQPVPRRDDTASQLRDLPDLAAHLELRATSSTPGAEPGRKPGPPEESAPVNLTVLHLLDGRRHARGDDVPRLLAEEARYYAHPDREPDDDGTVGIVPALSQWADMMLGDLDGWEPGVDSPPPTEDGTLVELCDWIARHLTGWQAVNPEAAPLLSAAVRRWHSRMRAELGETDPPVLRHTNLGGCGGRLLPLADGIRHECVDCHDVLTPGEMLGLARWQAEVTLPMAAAYMRIKSDRLRKWKERNPEEFPRPINPGKWPPLYRMIELRDAWERRGA